MFIQEDVLSHSNVSNLGCFVADDAQKKLLELGQGQCLSWMLTVAESIWSTVFLIS